MIPLTSEALALFNASLVPLALFLFVPMLAGLLEWLLGNMLDAMGSRK